MPRIPEYTVGIVRERQTPNNFSLQKISDAGATMRGISNIADAGARLAIQMKQADDATAVNDAIIAKQRSDIEWLETTRKQRENNPTGFAKEIEAELKKRDDDIAKNLPSSAAKRAFMQTSARLNLQSFESNFNWENTRRTQIFAARVQDSIENNNILMYRAGREGADPDQYLKNVDAATVAAGGVFAAEKLANINQAGRGEGLKYYLQGIIERNPFQAKKILESKKYDKDLGADGIARLYDATDRAIIAYEKKAQEASLVESLMSTGLADPSNAEHRKIIGKIYAESGLLDGLIAGDGDAINETINLVAKTSIVPEQAQTVLRGYMSNGTDEQRQLAYEIVARIEDVKPSAVSGPAGFSEREVKDAAAYAGLVRAGATPQSALASISAAADPQQKDMRDLRQQNLNKLMASMGPNDVLKEFGGFVGIGRPSFMGEQNQSRIFSEYRRIFADEYLRFGDEDSAHNAAMAAVKVNSGVSYVTGQKTMTQFPPEEYYGVPELTKKENAKWMRAELERDLEQYGYKGSIQDVALVPSVDAKTRINQGLRPIYHVMTQQEVDGFPRLDFIRDEKNMPIAIGFDTDAAQKKTLEKLKKRSEAAGEKRAVKAAIQQLPMPVLAKYVMGLGAEFEIDQKFTDPKENSTEKERARLMNEAADFYGMK